jgi:hypothetical protein
MRRSTISALAIAAFSIGATSAAHDQQAKAIYTASQFGAAYLQQILRNLEQLRSRSTR